MQQTQNTESRKKFLFWSAIAVSAIALFKFFPKKKKNQNVGSGETVKLLSQDGKLVEIDKRFLTSSGKMISNEELQKWIKR